jgi:hypothetical protein
MKPTLISAFVLAAVLAGFGIVPSRALNLETLKDEGVGLYTDPSVANQVSTFTINKQMVSCGVGTTNVFEMLMYSLKIVRYDVDLKAKTISATGKMRSITRVAGEVVEDADHDFIGIAEDNRDDPADDHFAIHFKTTFWQPGNSLCTPSNTFPGLCMFGGDVFAGDIVVGKNP